MRGPHNNNVHLILSWLVMIHIPTWCSMMYIYNVHMQVPIHGLLHPFQSQNTSTSFKISTTKSEYSQMCDITIQACNGVPDTRMMTSPVCMSSSLHVSALPCPYAMANNIGNFFFDKCHVSPQSHQWLKLIDSCEYYIMMVAVSSNLFFSGNDWMVHGWPRRFNLYLSFGAQALVQLSYWCTHIFVTWMECVQEFFDHSFVKLVAGPRCLVSSLPTLYVQMYRAIVVCSICLDCTLDL